MFGIGGPYKAFLNRGDALGGDVSVVARYGIASSLCVVSEQCHGKELEFLITIHFLTIYTIQLNGIFCFICLLTSSSLAQFALEAMHHHSFRSL